MDDVLDGDLLITPCPGYILGRQVRPSSMRTVGGIILPGASLQLPIIKVIAVGETPKSGDYRDDALWGEDFDAAPNDLLVVNGAEQMIGLGTGDLYIVAFESVVAKAALLPNMWDITS